MDSYCLHNTRVERYDMSVEIADKLELEALIFVMDLA